MVLRAAPRPSLLLSFPTDRPSAASFRPLDHLDLDLPTSRSPSPTRIFSRSTPPTQFISPLPFPVPFSLSVIHACTSPPPNALKSCSSPVLVPSSLVLSDTTHDVSILSSSARPPEPRNFNTASPQLHTSSSFYPLWNPWIPLPPYLPLLSLTCQVDMSSSRAPPGVSIPRILFSHFS
jgi:hypothetical protein